MRLPCTLLVSVMVLFTTIAEASTFEEKNPMTTSFMEEGNFDALIDQGLANLKIPFEVKSTGEVRKYIKRYLKPGYIDAQAMLGRSSLYFPIFEHFLNIYGLPQELKYLPMVESTLRPDVHSHAGAAGLWQFVPITARHFGLKINGDVDERMDPYKSTEAAVKLLAYLYEKLGDWPLVLAAYNSGAGRVRKAIRRADCDDYWEIRPYLSSESRKYVPAYIAAAYLAQNFQKHGLAPKYPSYEMQDTKVFTVYSRLNLRAISKTCNVDLKVLRKLNPSYRNNIIPTNVKGNYLVIPAVAATDFWLRYIPRNTNIAPDQGLTMISYTAVVGDNINNLALLFECSIEDIMKWNHLTRANIVVNQSLIFYISKEALVAKP